MILLLAIVLSFTIALIRGGRLERLADVRLRYGWIALIALGLQVLMVYGPGARLGWLMLASYGLLVLVVGLNWRLPGMPIMAMGLALNLVVMAANGGFMPISPETLSRAGLEHLASSLEVGAHVTNAKDVLLPREATRLWWLGDTLVMPLPSPLKAVFSVGDLLLAAGAVVFVQRAMAPKVAQEGAV
jgi:hypothetical protein